MKSERTLKRERVVESGLNREIVSLLVGDDATKWRLKFRISINIVLKSVCVDDATSED